MHRAGFVFLAVMTMSTPAFAGDSVKGVLRPERFEQLRSLIRPGPGEAKWAEVDWMPSSNIWAARQKAAAEGKPLFIWYMAGEPLGTC